MNNLIKFRSPTKVEMAMTIVIIILVLLTCGKGGDVRPIGPPKVVIDTFWIEKPPIRLTIESEPIDVKAVEILLAQPSSIDNGVVVPNSPKEKPVKTNRYTYKDSIPDGVITSTIYADTIYRRSIDYFRTDKQQVITKDTKQDVFNNRTYLGLSTNFNAGSNVFDYKSFTWANTSLELIHTRNKWYWGVQIGFGEVCEIVQGTGNINSSYNWTENNNVNISNVNQYTGQINYSYIDNRVRPQFGFSIGLKL